MDFQTILAAGMLLLVLTMVMSTASMKKQKSGWQGVLEKKIYREDNDTANEYYTLRFRTYDGKKIEVQVTAEIYHHFNLGDRAVKKPDMAYPERI